MARRISPQAMTKSLNFAASIDKVDCGADWIGTGDITVCGWINPRSAGTGGLEGRICDNGRTLVFLDTTNQLAISSDGGGTQAKSTIWPMGYNKWRFVSITRTSVGIVNFRINGTSSGTVNQSSGTPAGGTTNVFLGNKSDNSGPLNGKLKNIQVFNRILTTAEQDDIYYDGKQPSDYATSIISHFDFENDTATTIYSKNDITKTGTITGATFTKDVPPVDNGRMYPGRNLFVSKIDGSAGISPTGTEKTTVGWIEDERFHLYSRSSTAQVSVKLDNTVKRTDDYTLKLSCVDTSGVNDVRLIPTTSTLNYTISSVYGIKIKPSTTYTLSCYAKTNNVASNAVYLTILKIENNGTTSVAVSSSKISGTNDWTLLTINFTTGIRDSYLDIFFRNAVAGNISDAWFDINSLTLTEVITPRTAAGSRIAVRDYGTELMFDGSGDYVTISNHSSLNPTTGLTLSALVNPSNLTSTNTIFGKSDGGITKGYRLRISSNGIVTFFVASGGSQKRVDSALKLPSTNRWYLITVTANSTDARMYTNSVLETGDIQATGSELTEFTGNLRIGDDILTTGVFNGKIDNARIWNRALTATEISNLCYNNIVPRNGLVGEWLFNEGSGTTAYDTSGSGNNGTITGATYTTDVASKNRTSL